ncbi:MAG: transglutaminase-like domain-containing protein [Blastocatellia bacterium]
MKNRLKPLVLALILLPAPALCRAGAPPPEPKVRVFQFSYKATINQVPGGTKHLGVWLPYPTTDANQEVSDIQVSSPGKPAVYAEPRYGNSILYVSVDDLGAAPIDIQVSFKVRRSENIRKDFARVSHASNAPLDPAIEMYLQPDRLVPINAQIRQWAAEVTRGKKTDLEKARAIYDYTLATMKYDKSGEGWGRGDILYACDAKRGNCTDFHAVFIGFCRSLGIPARFAIGFPLPEKRGEGEIAGYHCWAEFYLKGYGWVPVDASEAWKHPEKRDYFFGAHDENRVQLSSGRDITLRPRQQGAALNYFVYPYAEADGKPIDTIKREFRFKDLGETDAKAF